MDNADNGLLSKNVYQILSELKVQLSLFDVFIHNRLNMVIL